MRSHPKNPWISNSSAARALIFLTRHRVPVLSRLYMYFLGCDIGLALPETVFLPHPRGIVIHRATRFGDDVVIGHQVTLGGRDLSNAAPRHALRITYLRQMCHAKLLSALGSQQVKNSSVVFLLR